MTSSSAPAQEAMDTDLHRATSTRLRGPWLVLARVAWIVLAVLAVGLFAASIPTSFAFFHVLCTGDPVTCRNSGQLSPLGLQTFRAVGLSLDFYATYSVALNIVFAAVYAAIGAVVFWRKSDDHMAFFASLALVLFPAAWDSSELATLPSAWWLPGQSVAFLGDISFFLFFYLFPTGRFIPPWTRWLWVAVVVLWAVNVFFPSLPFNSSIFFTILLLGFICSALVAQVYRYRRVSSTEQRQQTKWVVFGISIGLGGYLVLDIFSTFFPSLVTQSAFANLTTNTAFYLVFLFIPLSIGVAMLRSRLFDIDRIINRTLVYGTLTALLALVYLGGIIGLQSLLQGFTGGNQLAIASSTLLIAVLFDPLRHRIQNGIDRRFYRSKYAAVRTLTAFSATLRNEVDLDHLSEQLVDVVRETMQPTHVSLWLCSSAEDTEKTTRRLPKLGN